MSRKSTRRKFLQQSSAAAAGFWVFGGLTPKESRAANDKLNIASIGVGGKGSSDCEQAGSIGNMVAICDIDDNPLNNMAKRFPQAKKFHDYREMLEKMDKEIDAVTVSTPDHTHAPASVMAMKKKKAVYCQKPLTHTVYEARVMRETAAKMGVATQMGNQGTAGNSLRRAAEIIQAGVLGPITEVHVWTNRPIWPQGTDAILRVGGVRSAALAILHGKQPPEFKAPKVPENVHWELFLGPAPERPYDHIYHPFSWRGWLDFGTGALGDMACHTANLAFMALKLGHPTSVVAEAGETNPETYPMWAKITFQFPARGEMPPVKFVWYEGQKGGNKMLPPTDITKELRLPGSGSVLVGAKGLLYSPDDYGGSFQLLGKDTKPSKELQEAEKQVPQTLPRNGKGDHGMKAEWLAAVKGGPKPVSNFDYAGMLTEFILLGNVAVRAGNGQKLEWDGPNLKITNNQGANAFLKTDYRKGWEL